MAKRRVVLVTARRIKLTTEQHVIDKPSPMEGFPMREWSIRLTMLDENDNECPADCFNKVVYNLHPSFENPTLVFQKPPFLCENEGWGEFEMTIDCYYTEKSKIVVHHDLNFRQEQYETIQTISFKNPSQALQEKLREYGPLAHDDDGRRNNNKKGGSGGGGGAGAGANRRMYSKAEYERLGAAMTKLDEDDLLKVIQLIHDNKSQDTQVKSDVSEGEYSIDLVTMPDALTKKLIDLMVNKGVY